MRSTCVTDIATPRAATRPRYTTATRDPLRHRQPVVVAHVAALAPATPQVESAEHDDDDEEWIRPHDDEADHHQQPDEPERGMQRTGRATAVERDDRDEVEEVEEEAGECERDEELRARRLAGDPACGSADGAENRAGERDTRLLPGVVGKLLHPDHRAEERDEQRRARSDSLASELEDVSELVDEDQEHEADRERQSPDPCVRRDRDEHRGARRDHLELQEQAAELQEQEAEADDRRGQLAHEVADPGPRLDRLVAALPVLRRLGRREHRRLRRLDRLVPVGLPVYDPWPIHSSPPTYVSFFQSGTETFNSSIASRQAASAAARCGADTAMTTLVSPIVDAADSVVDRDPGQLVAIREPRRELLHDLLGHALVRLVLEVEDLPSTRVRARRPDERGDRAGAVVAHLGDRSVSPTADRRTAGSRLRRPAG